MSGMSIADARRASTHAATTSCVGSMVVGIKDALAGTITATSVSVMERPSRQKSKGNMRTGRSSYQDMEPKARAISRCSIDHQYLASPRKL